MKSFLLYVLTTLLLSILKVVCLLVAIAYFTLAERKIMAAVQRRVGPNVVGPFGLLQPLADGLKLAGKELAIPAQASSRIFLSVAITVLLFALSGWSAIPFGMFDHSEYMSNSSVAKTLVLTEPGFDMYRTALDLCFVSPESRGFLRF
jgi:NADH:ubiquinone oxidoreductase subunit H